MINSWELWSLRGWRVVFLAAGAVCVGSPQQQTGATSSPDAPPRALVEHYCAGCHNDRLKSGGLTLTSAAAQKIGQNTAVWEKVVRKLRARSMPPAGLPRPEETTYESVVSSLESSLDRIAAAKPDP